jgi:predicted esterase
LLRRYAADGLNGHEKRIWRRSVIETCDVLILLACIAASAAALPLAHSADAEPARPAMTEEDPGPGKFVKQVAEEYRGTGVYHALYLPSNWRAGASYPVIFEYAPNHYEKFTGRVEDCRMGFYQSGGRDFLWVVMPYIDSVKKANLDQWWGDEGASVQYCVTNLRRVCEKFGGDPNAVFLTGFSRGAIACGYLGLRDESVADIWLAFLPHSHIDGGRFTAKGASERLARARGRATFVTYGGEDDGRKESPKGARMLRELGFPVVEREIAGLKHTDAFIEQDSPIRREMRAWIAEILKARPGTHTLRGRVVDGDGKGVAGVRVQCGNWHWAFTDAEGRYTIPSLVPGKRKLIAEKAGLSFAPEQKEITMENQDVEAGPVTAQPARP